MGLTKREYQGFIDMIAATAFLTNDWSKKKAPLDVRRRSEIWYSVRPPLRRREGDRGVDGALMIWIGMGAIGAAVDRRYVRPVGIPPHRVIVSDEEEWNSKSPHSGLAVDIGGDGDRVAAALAAPPPPVVE